MVRKECVKQINQTNGDENRSEQKNEKSIARNESFQQPAENEEKWAEIDENGIKDPGSKQIHTHTHTFTLILTPKASKSTKKM